MSNEPTEIDWLLHNTRGHTPTEEWERRNSLEFYFQAHADELLVKAAPKFREEVERLREELKQANQFLRDIRDGRIADEVWLHINKHLGGD